MVTSLGYMFKIWVFPKIWENPQIIPFVHRVFYKPSILGSNPPIFGSTPIYELLGIILELVAVNDQDQLVTGFYIIQ